MTEEGGQQNADISNEALDSKYPGLGKTYWQFLKSYAEFTNGKDQADAFYERLINDQPVLNSQVLAQLESIRNATKLPAPVLKARKALITLFTNHPLVSNLLKELEAKVIIYGSLQYGDPRNLDADILVVFEDQPTPDIGRKFDMIKVETEYLWEYRKLGFKRYAEPQLSLFSLSIFDNIPKSMSDDPESFKYDSNDLAVAISGEPLLMRDKGWVLEFRERSKKVAESDPLLCAMVNESLQKCLNVRIARRNLPQPTSS